MLPFETDLPAGTQTQWRELADGVLKGGAFEKLVGKTADGLAIQPLYQRPGHAGPRAFRQQVGPWRVAQRADHPDAAMANAFALADLDGGASALTLAFAGGAGGYGFGLPADIGAVLAGVEPDLISIRIDPAGSGAAQARLFADLVEQRRLVPANLDVDFGCDPLGDAARAGATHAANIGDEVAQLSLRLHDKGYAGTMFMADGRLIHQAGGSEAQELAHVLTSAVFYLRTLQKHGLGLGDARKNIAFLLAADADQFMGIAKFRAIRRLWARVEESCGLVPEPIRLHAETAWRMMTRRDPFVNVLRSTMAVFAAGIGGADVITTLPFTLPLGLPDSFARRIARNSQLVLLQEANLAKVADPAAGAGGYEALTDDLCVKAWALFQDIERCGGIVAALASGTLQAQVAEIASQRAKAFATRKAAVTGTSEFPSLDEKPVPVLFPAPAAAPHPFAARRDAEPFEALRDASDAWLRQHGSRPKVFLANLGPLAGFAARSQFAASLFASGGIETVSGDAHARTDGATDIDAVAQAACESHAALVCICGSDAAYAIEAAALANRLAGHFKSIILAGRPMPELGAAGVTHFIYAGCDVIAQLRAAYAVLKD